MDLTLPNVVSTLYKLMAEKENSATTLFNYDKFFDHHKLNGKDDATSTSLANGLFLLKNTSIVQEKLTNALDGYHFILGPRFKLPATYISSLSHVICSQVTPGPDSSQALQKGKLYLHLPLDINLFGGADEVKWNTGIFDGLAKTLVPDQKRERLEEIENNSRILFVEAPGVEYRANEDTDQVPVSEMFLLNLHNTIEPFFPFASTVGNKDFGSPFYGGTVQLEIVPDSEEEEQQEQEPTPVELSSAAVPASPAQEVYNVCMPILTKALAQEIEHTTDKDEWVRNLFSALKEIRGKATEYFLAEQKVSRTTSPTSLTCLTWCVCVVAQGGGGEEKDGRKEEEGGRRRGKEEEVGGNAGNDDQPAFPGPFDQCV